jgi:hypothetical protein
MTSQHPRGMFVLSQLNFGSYLSEPSYAAAVAASRLPLPCDRHLVAENKHRGDFDILGILHGYGLFLAEIKSVGNCFHKSGPDQRPMLTQPQQDAAVNKKIRTAIKQLDKADQVLRHLVSDVSPVIRVTKTIIFPNMCRTQLQRVILADEALLQVFI